MKKHQKIGLMFLLITAVVAATGWFLHGHTIGVLQPAGEIGSEERNLIIACSLLSVIVVVPVFTLLFTFAWRYREDNTRAKYTPDQDGSPAAEIVWWLIPAALLVVISIITWRSSYAMDPFRHLNGKKTLHIQVVAMDWKWLFIYPGEKVASVNEAAVPMGTPVDFEITSDTVMTSFWDPQLGGQMYAMPGMSTHLNLVASKTGNFPGAAANISGKGFAGMKFTVQSVRSTAAFNDWITHVRQSGRALDTHSYASLTKPSYNNPVAYYGSVDPSLYDTIVMKYMMPTGTGDTNMSAADARVGSSTMQGAAL